MRKVIGFFLLMSALGFGITGLANSLRSLRATEINSKLWSEFEQGELKEVLIEFRQGDRLPVNLKAAGDLIETFDQGQTFVNVKKSFWMKFDQRQIQFSLDGNNFKPFNEAITGSINVGASAEQDGGPANAITVLLKANLK